MKKMYLILIAMSLFCLENISAQKRHKKNIKKSTKVAKDIKKESSNVLHQEMLLCYTMYDMPSWYLQVVNGFKFPENMQVPANYRIASINDTLLNKYLHTIPYDVYNKKITIPIYQNFKVECKEFLIQRVITMDSGLQAKYPELMSFKAMDEMNKLNTARIDCDGVSTKIMVNMDGQYYFVTPVVFNKKTYYVCYAQNDPNFQKQTFE